MTEKKRFHAVRGVRDILPPDTSLWNWFEATARDVLETFHFREIRVPVLEETELFARSVGAETDIVSKEMYTFIDRDETAISLRPEATASVVRAYIEHGMQMLPGLVKLYYAGPMFRRERPQKGRYRQFYQIGAEVLGATDHPAIDAELIEMLTVLLERCKLENWTLLVNSIGDANCRPQYVARLREALAGVKSQLCGDCQRRAAAKPGGGRPQLPVCFTIVRLASDSTITRGFQASASRSSTTAKDMIVIRSPGWPRRAVAPSSQRWQMSASSSPRCHRAKDSSSGWSPN